MHRLGPCALHLLRNEDGFTAVECPVMVAVIVVVSFAAVTAVGSHARATSPESGRASRAVHVCS
jgi:Flp pilus assembly pilin Flp